MSIHYKFKSALEYDTVTFDGLHISVKDLKKQILQQKKIGKSTDFDLQITNAQTKETYTDENELISKNASLIVARVPVAVQPRKQWDKDNHTAAAKIGEITDGGLLGKSVDIAALDLPEEDKIRTMMSQSTSEYDPSNYIKVKGGNQIGPVPAHYVCHKCHQRGHWIKDCKALPSQEGPGIGDSIRKSSGIPRSFMVPVDGPQVPGARMTPTGAFAVPAIDHQVYKEKKIEKPPFLVEKEKPVESTPIPDDLQCVICKDLMTDAVMAPCCGNSFCDECIRSLLVESDDAECPECNEKEVSPDTLIPNRFLRTNVNNFKNKTGYTKRSLSGNKDQSPPRPSLPDFVPPGSDKAAPIENGNSRESKRITADANDAGSSNVDANSFLYDIAVEKDGDTQKETKEKPGDLGQNRRESRDRERRSSSQTRSSGDKKIRSSRGDADDVSSLSSKGSLDPPPGEVRLEAPEGVYSIPSLVPVHPHSVNRPNIHTSYHPSRNHAPFLHGGERSGTPTIDERYEPYGRPMGIGPHLGPGPGPGPGMEHGFTPVYNPYYPPPLVGNPYGGNYRDRSRPYRGRYPPRHLQQPARHVPADDEEAYLAFQRMLQEKEEREKRKQGTRPVRTGSRSRSRSRARSHSRSRSRSRPRSKSPSAGRRRSYTPKRSRSRSRTPRQSRSASRDSRARSFVISRSRSRSYSKSPIDRKFSPRKYVSPPRSPYRYDRGREAYLAEGGYGWDRRDRRGGYRNKGRLPHTYPSPPRHFSSYNRYREECETPPPPPRGYISPDRYGEPHARGYGGRWNDGRNRRHSRSGSATRYYDEDAINQGEGREQRSNSRGHRERTPLVEDRHKTREGHSRDRNGRRFSREKSREQEKDQRRRDPSPNRRRAEKDRSRSGSRRKSPPSHHVKEHRIRSSTPSKQRKRSRSPVTKSDDRKRSTSPSKQRKRTKTPPSRHEHSPRTKEPIRDAGDLLPDKIGPSVLDSRLEEELLARNPSPAVMEKQKITAKKEKKKDKDKKKRKKEKETDEEREARKKRKKEKKEKKKLLAGHNPERLPDEFWNNEPTHGTEKEKEGKNESPPSLLADPNLETPIRTGEAGIVVELQHASATRKQSESEKPGSEALQTDTDNDEVLDLHASYENLGEPEMLAPMPELSRWELEEAGLVAPARVSSPDAPRGTTVTSEVLKRAENAIFKKAISALRPETSKKSSDKVETERKPRSLAELEKEKRPTDSPEREKKKGRDDPTKVLVGKAALDEEPPSRVANIEDYSKRIPSKEQRPEESHKRAAAKEPYEEPLRRGHKEISVDERSLGGKESDRLYREVPVKVKSDTRKPANSIQITIPVSKEKEEREVGYASFEKKRSPPHRVSVKDRLGGKVDGSSSNSRRSPQSTVVARVEERSRPALLSSVEAVYKRLPLDEAQFVPIYEESSEEDERHAKLKKSSNTKRSPESNKRLRSSSESSDDSVKKKKKRSKHKKEKKAKKKSRKESETSDSTDSEFEKKKQKKLKKRKKSRH